MEQKHIEQRKLSKKLREELYNGVVSFSYEKKNGEWREALGTTNPECIDFLQGKQPGSSKVISKMPKIVAYYDINVSGWRSCLEDSIITINKVYTVDEWKSEREQQEN